MLLRYGLRDNPRDGCDVDFPGFIEFFLSMSREIYLCLCVRLFIPLLLVPYIRGLKNHTCNFIYILRDNIYILLINIYNIRLLPVPQGCPAGCPAGIFSAGRQICFAIVITHGSDPLNLRPFVP